MPLFLFGCYDCCLVLSAKLLMPPPHCSSYPLSKSKASIWGRGAIKRFLRRSTMIATSFFGGLRTQVHQLALYLATTSLHSLTTRVITASQIMCSTSNEVPFQTFEKEYTRRTSSTQIVFDVPKHVGTPLIKVAFKVAKNGLASVVASIKVAHAVVQM